VREKKKAKKGLVRHTEKSGGGLGKWKEDRDGKSGGKKFRLTTKSTSNRAANITRRDPRLNLPLTELTHRSAKTR